VKRRFSEISLVEGIRAMGIGLESLGEKKPFGGREVSYDLHRDRLSLLDAEGTEILVIQKKKKELQDYITHVRRDEQQMLWGANATKGRRQSRKIL